MNFLYKHVRASKLIIFALLIFISALLTLILHFVLKSTPALILNILGLSYLFAGSLIFSDSVGRWGAHNLWTYKYGSSLQGLGFITSLAGIMSGEASLRIPNFVISAEWVSAYANIALTAITLIGVGYAILQYRFNKQDKDERDRPYVFVDLEPINGSSLLNLLIRNTGASPARHIKIEFNPDFKIHESSETTISNMRMMQDMKFLASGSYLKFFFGSMLGETQISKEFTLKIAYQDIKGKVFNEEQVIDPRDFLGLSSMSEKGLNDIGKALIAISKTLDKTSQYQEETADNIFAGITPRNADLTKFSEVELRSMLKNIVNYGHQNELFLGRSSQDTKAVIRLLRDKLLIKSDPTPDEQKMITQLSDLLMDRFQSGTNSFESGLKSVFQ